MEEEIKFYAVSDKYGELSNFALYPIKIKSTLWPTVEHYFQAQKFNEKTYQEKIRQATNPMKAAELGRSRRVKIVRNWDSKKDQVMYEALVAKFTQHAGLQELLINTGNAKLVEHTENDNYWGDDGNGKGLNKLGKLLMKVRHELSNQ